MPQFHQTAKIPLSKPLVFRRQNTNNTKQTNYIFSNEGPKRFPFSVLNNLDKGLKVYKNIYGICVLSDVDVIK